MNKHTLKIIIFLLIGVLTVIMLQGCFGAQPDENERIQRIEDLVSGEHISIQGEDVYSQDRDLHFRAYWEEGLTELGLGVKVKTGTYQFYTDYYEVLHGFWNEEYRKRIDSYQFENVDYGSATGALCRPNVVYIYMDVNASDEDRAKVESMLKDLREICQMENAYHQSEILFNYAVHLYYIEEGTDRVEWTDRMSITMDSEDDELTIDAFTLNGNVTYEKLYAVPSNGNAKIIIGPKKE